MRPLSGTKPWTIRIRLGIDKEEISMGKYLVLYNSDLSAEELMANATAEEMKASMQEWMAWAEEAKKSVGFEFGMPLKAVSKVTKDGTNESDSNVSGYSIMEGDT